MIKTNQLQLLVIISFLFSITLQTGGAKTIKRKISVKDFEEPLYYHQMTHHKTQHKTSTPESQEVSSSPPTPAKETRFSIVGQIMKMVQFFGKRSGFTEWWWGEK